jgi:hypothetical protein
MTYLFLDVIISILYKPNVKIDCFNWKPLHDHKTKQDMHILKMLQLILAKICHS